MTDKYLWAILVEIQGQRIAFEKQQLEMCHQNTSEYRKQANRLGFEETVLFSLKHCQKVANEQYQDDIQAITARLEQVKSRIGINDNPNTETSVGGRANKGD